MKKTALVLIAILTVLLVIVIFVEYKRFFGEQLLPIIVMFAVGSLPGILLSLLTRIPAVRKRAQSNLAGRVVTLLAVMILAVVLMFFVTTRLGVQLFYVFAPLSMNREINFDYVKFEAKRSAIHHETWIRVMVPPLLRRQCYTIEKDVCEFVDQLHENRESMSQNGYLQGVALVLTLSLPGGAFAWYFTRKKQSPEVVIESSDQKNRESGPGKVG